MVGQGIVNRVYLGVGQQLLVRAVGFGDAQLLCCRLRPAHVARADGDDLAVLALLAETTSRTTAIGYLLIYNVMFVLPLIVISGAVIGGMKAQHIEKLRTAKRGTMKLALGLFMIALGAWMLL